MGWVSLDDLSTTNSVFILKSICVVFLTMQRYPSGVKLILAAVSNTRSKPGPMDAMTTEYVARCARYAPSEPVVYPSEKALLTTLERVASRTAPYLILLDSRGKQLSSEQFAAHLGQLRDGGSQTVVLAIGPADGWSEEARVRANLLLSLGPMTLPHELARVVLAEQVYRALTILAGHPYHCGHQS